MSNKQASEVPHPAWISIIIQRAQVENIRMASFVMALLVSAYQDMVNAGGGVCRTEGSRGLK